MNDDSDSCKVVLIGETGVGKTSIINQFIEQDFVSNRLPTSGATFFTKTMKIDEPKREIKFEIWDTAGQEKYRSLTSMFYKDASIAVLVYDITREDSFSAIQNYWIEQIKENGPEGMILAIAANKADLYEDEKVPEQTGREFAESVNAIFKQTSAKNFEGINNLFYALGQKYLHPANKVIIEEEDTETQKKLKLDLDPNKQVKEDEKKKKKCC